MSELYHRMGLCLNCLIACNKQTTIGLCRKVAVAYAIHRGSLGVPAIRAGVRRRKLISRRLLVSTVRAASRSSWSCFRPMITSYVWPPPSRYLIAVSAGRSKRWTSTATQPSNSISWPLELLAHPSLSINKRRLLKPLSPHQQISRRNDSVMTYHSIVECVTNRPFEQVADAKHQATHSMIARSGAYARVRSQARGRAGAPLPARGAMAPAPPPKLSWKLGKIRYDIKLSHGCGKHVAINQYIKDPPTPKLSGVGRKHVTINQYIKATARFLSLRLLNK